MTVDVPLEMFRITILPTSSRFFCVCVAETHADMVAAMSRIKVQTPQPDAHVVASCMAASAPGAKWEGLVGFLFFSRDAMTAGIVAHEFAHAGFRALEHSGRRLKHWRNVGRDAAEPSKRLANATEECYADIVEHLTRAFWREAYARGLAVSG